MASTKHSYLSNADGAYIEDLYKRYKEDPDSIDQGWRMFFEGFEFQRTDYTGDGGGEGGIALAELNVRNMIQDFRNRGHLFTRTNPVRERRKYTPTLELGNYDLSETDLDTVFQAGTEVGLGPATLRDIVELLDKTYCRSIGVEYRYARKPEIVEWLREKMESSRNTPTFTLDEKKHILKKLNQAVAFETFLGSKYVGQKRFSLEGAESLIPALDAVIERGYSLGMKECIIGMAHRGRLNILANILNKTYDEIFSEFEGHYESDGVYDGDVKYHMGFSTDVSTEDGGSVHLSLCPNPSHLEAVAPVAQGNGRAKIDKKYGGDEKQLATIIIHGDAAVAGQGVVYEVVQMSELPAYHTGGCIHVVINNQVGFTTNYTDARSSVYCTDVAKVTQSPVFHVNGDDVEAVVYASKLAMEFRQKFHKDVFIDLLCYRKHGHNEGDEPRFTQPTLYKAIEKHPDPRAIYFQKLLDSGQVGAKLAKEMEKNFKRFLQDRLKEIKEKPKSTAVSFGQSSWKSLHIPTFNEFLDSPDTSIPEKTLRPLAEKITQLPSDKKFYSKIERIFDARKKMLTEDRLDWAMGELMAYASLLMEEFPVRMTGQDVQRGTFAHRHAVITYDDSDKTYTPLNHLAEKQAKLEIYNSLLSEYAVLGFEYGYSWASPNSLTIWEAQFGDFANGAQIMIDQFIASALTKWRRLSGLVMLLPHGYEGQGPEHSSARLERFLTLCGGNSMMVAQPTTPSNIFHLLRRQIHREFRAPIVVMTPKSLLRHPKAVSKFSDFTSGGFRELIDDEYVTTTKVTRILFCSGKIYYDLLKKQEEDKRKDIAIVRLEQLYPLPHNEIRETLAKYKKAKEYVWVQEEPANMGSWPHILRKIKDYGIIPNMTAITRKENATTATGYKKQHEKEQANIINASFAKVPVIKEELVKKK